VALLLGGWMLAQGILLALSKSARDARRLLLASYVYVPIALLTMAIDKV
jgi:heme O synthase-like polyprenyltransferase